MSASQVFLVFGEDYNDRAALVYLLRALCPAGAKPTIKNLRQPVVLSRNAVASGKRRKMAEDIAGLAKAHCTSSSKVHVVAHRDCDASEPAHVAEASELEAELMAAGVDNPIAATPAWEIEAWWMLFPLALREVRGCWKHVDYGHQHVGRFKDAKERLVRDLRPDGLEKRRRCPEFREEDGVKVAEQVALKSLHLRQVTARSDSFALFCHKINTAFSRK